MATSQDLVRADQNLATLDGIITSNAESVPDYNGDPKLTVAEIQRRSEAAVAAAGFYPVAGSFEAGGNITERNQVLQRTTAPAAYFSWGGVIPPGGLVIPPGSTVAGTGGEGVTAWTNRNDTTIRGDLANGTAAIGSTTVGSLLAGSFKFPKLLVGAGVKGNPQTNVGLQIHRDIIADDFSSHGFNCADYFAVNGIAFNPFGADIQIGDGTQGAEVALGHVNDFQVTDITDLGLGRNAQHYCFISQPRLESGTITRTTHFLAVDQLGVRDTPGFGVPNFEVNGPAIGNNQTGLVTVIRHGTNAKSIHVQAGSTDAGVTKTSGGAPVDIEAPVIIRQETESTSLLSGALILTAGGLGVSGRMNAKDDISSWGAVAAQFSLRTDAGVLRGRIVADASFMRIISDEGDPVRIRVGASDIVGVQSDRLSPIVDNSILLGNSANRYSEVYVRNVRTGAGGSIWTSGTGSPEGVLAANVGSMYTRTDGGAGTTLYVKEAGTGSTGWVAK